ncbi:MAG: ribosome biogenesis protein [Nitrososphaerales archaeon]
MLLYVVLVESALELVPRQLWDERSVLSSAKNKGKHPSQILLDRSLHHTAMLKLKDGLKRGRPDLVHQAVLAVTGTPAYLKGEVKLYIHTYANLVLEVVEGTRLPKSYFRFQGLIEKVLSREEREKLIRVEEMGFKELLDHINADIVIGFSRRGVLMKPEEWVSKYVKEKTILAIGGFPRGIFSQEVLNHLHAIISIHEMPLESHVVLARVIYDYERFRRQA